MRDRRKAVQNKRCVPVRPSRGFMKTSNALEKNGKHCCGAQQDIPCHEMTHHRWCVSCHAIASPDCQNASAAGLLVRGFGGWFGISDRYRNNDVTDP
eukprot:1304170-Rhodomonas_salina.1